MTKFDVPLLNDPIDLDKNLLEDILFYCKRSNVLAYVIIGFTIIVTCFIKSSKELK